MASIRRLVQLTRKSKFDAAKQRRQAEKKLKESVSIQRKSTSGLSSLQRRLEAFHENIDQVSSLLVQRLAQKDSIQRLKATAETRLQDEQDPKERAEQEVEFADSVEEKENALSHLKIINDRILELKAEIKERISTERKLSKTIEEYTKLKSKLLSQSRNQSKNKPTLLEMAQSSKKKSEKLRSLVGIKTRREKNVEQRLAQISEKLRLIKKLRPKKTKTKKKTRVKKKTTRRVKPQKSKRRAKTSRIKIKSKSKKRTKKRQKVKKQKSKARSSKKTAKRR